MNKKKKHKKYDANFTAGGLLYHEFIVLEPILLSEDFAVLIKKEQEENQLIGISTLTARKRIVSEIIRRYNIAPKDFWEHFFEWTEKDQKLGLFYLCLKAYPLIMDLHFETTLKRYRTGGSLEAYDITMRLDEIAAQFDEVATWSSSTLERINWQYRKALKDAGLLENEKLVIPQDISLAFQDYFVNIGEGWFLQACFIEN